MTPDETAERVLKGVIARKRPTYMEFRESMLNEHPEVIPEEVIHHLYVHHVGEYSPVKNDVIETLVDRALLDENSEYFRRASKTTEPPLRPAIAYSGQMHEGAEALWERITPRPRSRWARATDLVRNALRSRHA